MTERPPSPCITICQLDTTLGICAGCGRTLDEIAEWGNATAERQCEIVQGLADRMSRLNPE
jgi:predicted Fe-S protein YdhL (DUF1289 family)